MARKPDHLRRSIKINNEKIRIPNGQHPFKIEVEKQEDGNTLVKVTTKDKKTSVLDFIREVDEAILACKTDQEKESVCLKFSSKVDDWTNRCIDLNKNHPIHKNNFFHFRDALKAKGYYRATH